MCGNGDTTGSAVLWPGLARLFLFMTTPQLNSLNIETTAITRLGTLDSDDPERNFPQQPQPQVQSVELPGVNFDFLNHVYYINVRLNKSQSNPAALAGTPRIIAIQICSIIVIG